MKKIIIIAIALCIVLPACSKKDNKYPLKSNSADSINYVPATDTTGPVKMYEDEEKPIKIDKPKDHQGVAIIGCIVQYVHGKDTISGISDNSGLCILQLPFFGLWEQHVSHSGFACFVRQINIVDSLTTTTDTLIAGSCQ